MLDINKINEYNDKVSKLTKHRDKLQAEYDANDKILQGKLDEYKAIYGEDLDINNIDVLISKLEAEIESDYENGMLLIKQLEDEIGVEG